ncbi:MAG TPA: cupin domain-containing protein [Solirubrobacteraceae bacterium]|jgi:mannose-6-phosphate isomerase-like protein (cupin superfamily)
MAHTIKNIEDVEDIAGKHGFSELGEARFAREDLDATDTGLSHQRLKPNKRQAFGHRHEQAEEIYLILSGSGRVKLDDEIVDVKRLDAIRVSPKTTRSFEAGPDGMELVAFGPHMKGDGEIFPNWWSD